MSGRWSLCFLPIRFGKRFLWRQSFQVKWPKQRQIIPVHHHPHLIQH